MKKPTLTTYGDLQFTYDFLNEQFFENKLPQCLITLERPRNPRVMGHFAYERLTNPNYDNTDIINLNPEAAAKRELKATVSTLLHEMVHQWQYHFGSPSRRGYHDKEWAKKMKEVGLYPSDTGEVGGKETGDSCSHYVIEGGVYDKAFDELMQECPNLLEWKDRFALLAGYREKRLDLMFKKFFDLEELTPDEDIALLRYRSLFGSLDKDIEGGGDKDIEKRTKLQLSAYASRVQDLMHRKFVDSTNPLTDKEEDLLNNYFLHLSKDFCMKTKAYSDAGGIDFSQFVESVQAGGDGSQVPPPIKKVGKLAYRCGCAKPRTFWAKPDFVDESCFTDLYCGKCNQQFTQAD